MSVSRICRRNVFVANVHESVRDVAQRMRDHNVGTVVVIDDARAPVGMLTDRDIALRVVVSDRKGSRTPVLEVMTIVPRTVTETAPIEVALHTMRTGKFRRLPVVDAAGRLVGLVSLDDVLVLFAQEFRQIGGLLRGERPCDEAPPPRPTARGAR